MMQGIILGRSTWKTAQRGKTLLEQTTFLSIHLAVKAYDKSLRVVKRTSWRTFCGEVDSIIPSTRLQRVLSKYVIHQMGALGKDAAKHLLMTHFPGCQPIEEHHSLGCVLQEPTKEDWDKVRWAIDDVGTFTAAGEDGIFPGLLQHGIEIIIIGHIAKNILPYFAACLAYGYIPLAWRAVRVIFIPKPGRDSYKLAKSFISP
jgi:hypothetical protein